MKKLLLLIPFLILVSCLDYENVKDEIFPNIATKAIVDGLELPNGTIVKKIGNSTIKIQLPKGYEIWEFSEDDTLKIRSEGCYTCECSGVNGCNVFYVKGVYGCSHSKCTDSCIGTFNNSFTRADLYKKLFIVDTNAKLTMATEKDFKNLKYIPERLVEHIKNEFRNFARDLYGDKFLAAIKYVDRSFQNELDVNDIVYIKMKIYGYKLIYGISTNSLKSKLISSYPFKGVGKDHSCK